MNVTDLLVETSNPKALDDTVQCLGPAVVIQSDPNAGTYLVHEGCYVVRVLGGNPGFIKFAIDQQGYGRVVRQLDNPIP